MSTELGAWVQMAQRLPAIDVPVWLYEHGCVFIGCRVDDSDGWLWALGYGMQYLDEQGIWKLADSEIEDIRPTLWQPLPEAPHYLQTELDSAATAARELHARIQVD